MAGIWKALREGSTVHRASLAAFGALAGLCFWILGEVLSDLLPDRPLLVIAATMGAFFSMALALAGPMRLARAVAAGAVGALVIGLLVYLGALAYTDPEQFLGQGSNWVAYLSLIALPLPFILTRHLTGGFDYDDLFDQAWSVFNRVVIGGLFIWLCWGVILLSHLTLSIVKIEVLELLWEEEWSVMVLSGAFLGLGLAIIDELEDYVNPTLALRLQRILTVPVFAVVLVFLVAAPVQGLSDLVKWISPAALMFAMAALAAALVTSVVDRHDGEAATAPLLTFAARGLALAMPFLTGLAAYALWLRVGEYGLTPLRIAGLMVLLIATLYGAAYFVAVLRGASWMGHIRVANRGLALGLIALAALWLSPLIAPEAWSTRDQIARYDAGQITAEQLPLWEMKEDWGVAGARGFAALEARDDPALVAHLDRVSSASNRYAYRQAQRAEVAREDVEAILAKLALSESQRALWSEALGTAQSHMVRQMRTSCVESDNRWCHAIEVPDGTRTRHLVIAQTLGRLTAFEALPATGETEAAVRATSIVAVAPDRDQRDRLSQSSPKSLQTGRISMPGLTIEGEEFVILPGQR